jgi:D-cysteine desulfhydrase
MATAYPPRLDLARTPTPLEPLPRLSEDLTREGLHPYIIPEGGSDEVGAWGYARALEELLDQTRAQGAKFDTVVHAVGSGGTSAGLILGRKLHGFEGRVLGFAVCNDVAYFTGVVLQILARTVSRYSLPASFQPEDLWFDDGYVGAGYAKTRPEEVRHLAEVARREGLLLDPVYTNKAFYGSSSGIPAGSSGSSPRHGRSPRSSEGRASPGRARPKPDPSPPEVAKVVDL